MSSQCIPLTIQPWIQFYFFRVSETHRFQQVEYSHYQLIFSKLIMLRQFRFELAGVDDEDVLMVGDRDEDRLAAEAVGVEFLWAEAWVRSCPFVPR